MQDDITKLQEVEKRLIEAMQAAASTAESLTTKDKSASDAHCSSFVQHIQESQKLMLEVADKYQKPVAFTSDDYAEKIRLAAAEQLKAAHQLLDGS